MGWERQPVTERKRVGWGVEQRGQCRGEDWSNRKHKEWKSITSHFLQSLISPFSVKVHADLVIWS